MTYFMIMEINILDYPSLYIFVEAVFLGEFGKGCSFGREVIYQLEKTQRTRRA